MANSLPWISPPFYTATKFDSTTYLTHAGILTGIADSQLGLYSFWLNMDRSSDDGIDYDIMEIDNSDHLVRMIRNGTGGLKGIRILCKNAALATVIDISSTTALLAAGGWHHIMITYDLSAAANKEIYVDGVATFAGGGTFDFGANVAAHQVGYSAPGDVLFAFGADSKLFGSISEFYFQVPTTYFTDTTKFRSAAGFPVPLGPTGSLPTGVQPFIYLHNDFNSFGTNLGSGGNFTTTTGAMLNAPSIPP